MVCQMNKRFYIKRLKSLNSNEGSTAASRKLILNQVYNSLLRVKSRSPSLLSPYSYHLLRMSPTAHMYSSRAMSSDTKFSSSIVSFTEARIIVEVYSTTEEYTFPSTHSWHGLYGKV